MRQESGGQQYLGGRPITSPAGAMGLMQVMPDTYEGLRQRYGLGNDPYDPHDNIMAGTAYLREMYDRFGSPNFLAAYNAGPGRMDDHLSDGSPLPDETVQYVASIAPRLGDANPSDGYEATAWNANGGCDPLAAYDPNGACATPGAQPAATVAATPGPGRRRRCRSARAGRRCRRAGPGACPGHRRRPRAAPGHPIRSLPCRAPPR